MFNKINLLFNVFIKSLKSLQDRLLSGLYEIQSYFVPQRIMYKVEGNCIKCGACCRYMYSFDTYNEKEFELMQKIYPKYKRFRIVGKDEEGNLIFACNLVGEDGLCTDYKNRLRMCKKYPKKRISFYGKLHDTCGYRVKPEKSFEDYLK